MRVGEPAKSWQERPVLHRPAWQAWLRRTRPPLLVTWGQWDPAFSGDEVEALRRDQPGAETHVLDAGHFALDEASPEIARLLRAFLDRLTRR